MKMYNLLLKFTNGKSLKLVASNDIKYFQKKVRYFKKLVLFTDTILYIKLGDCYD